jgi:glycosyltransferase involved in cell wall biosynthesis
MKSTLVLPAYNEEEALPEVLRECVGMVDEVIVVDDGSTDRTSKVAGGYGYGVRLYRHRDNRGKPVAIRTGVGGARGSIVVIMDADYTYPARYIPRLIEEVEKGADLALGSRFLGGKRGMPFLRVIANRIASLLLCLSTGRRITDPQTGYRAFRREDFEKLDVEARGLEYEVKMSKKALKLGLNIVEIPIDYRRRIGRSKLRPIDICRMLSAILWEK